MMLLYGNRLQTQILAGDELATMAAEGRLQLAHVLGEPPAGWCGETGQIDAALIRRHCAAAAAEEWLFVLCGPAPMLQAARAALRDLGVPHGRMLAEQFSSH